MKRKISITNRLLLSFFIMSIISIVIILVFYVVYSRGWGGDYTLYAYLLSSLVFFKNYIPYIIALSVYFAFFKGSFFNQESVSKVIAIPISLIVLLVMFYALYDYYFVTSFVDSMNNHNAMRDSQIYHDYEFKLKEQAYQKSKDALMAGNLKDANAFAEEALFYDKNDVNTLLLVKSIQEENKKEYEREHKAKINNINNLMKLGAKEFSSSNYDKAYKYFDEILNLDKHNPLALYYLNRISIARNRKPKYAGNTTEEISVYGKLSEVIDLYESGRLWEAYSNVSKVYMESPGVVEVNNYYSIIKDSISRYDFFIREAEEIKEVFLDNDSIVKNYSFNLKNGINLMLDKNTLLSSTTSIMFRDSLYMYDISIIEFDSELKVISSDFYLYGKIADAFKATNNRKNIILKGHFDEKKNDYEISDVAKKIIPINMSYNTINVIKNYSSLNLQYLGISDLRILRDEVNSFGYSNKNVSSVLLRKHIEPISYLLLFIIIAYYSFRFRFNMANEPMRFYHKVAGVLGTLLITLIYGIIINYIIIVIATLSQIVVSTAIAAVFVSVLILFIIFQMARIPRDAR